MNEIPTSQETPYVKEIWFKSFVTGNIIWPQTLRGIKVLTFAAVLEEPPNSWREFRESTLSQEQIKRVGEIMSRGHHINRVEHAVEKFRQPEDALVTNERLQGLWDQARSRIDHEISYFLLGHVSATGNDLREEVALFGEEREQINSAEIIQIDDLLQSPSQAHRRSELKDIIFTARGLYLSKLGLRIAHIDRISLTQTLTLEELESVIISLVSDFPELNSIYDRELDDQLDIPFGILMDLLFFRKFPKNAPMWFFLGVSDEARGI